MRLKENSGGQNTWEEPLSLRRQQEEPVTTGNGHLSQSLRGNSMTATVPGSDSTHSMKRADSATPSSSHWQWPKVYPQEGGTGTQGYKYGSVGEQLPTMYKTLDSIPNTTTKTKPQDQPRCPT